ncbi:MAG TPA: galactose ABC transporter substrate-binding protein [Candidatus Scybalomonas excrementigallinarum]|nr:galactose ABC transporter substrate-binding protein [Candidatus Scybalomonas excrementigallinarum]
MKKKKVLMLGIIFCISMPFLSGCKVKQSDTLHKIHVGVAYYNQSDTFLNELIACFKEEMEKLDKEKIETTVTIRDAAGSQRTQNDQVKELIDAGCNVLCVNLVDRADPSDIIDMAKEKNVPIIFFNREPVAEDLMQWDGLYYVGADAKQSGVMQGELVAEAINSGIPIDKNKDGKIQYVVLEGEAGHQDTIIRTENAVNTLRSYGIELEKLSYQIANWNRAQAQNRMEQMIAQYHNKVELVLANNDDMALGAIDAYEKLNLTDSAFPVFFGIDGTDVGLKAVRDSKLAGTVYNDKEKQAEAMAKLVFAVVTEKGMKDIPLENDKYIFVTYSKITTKNVDEFLEDDK